MTGQAVALVSTSELGCTGPSRTGRIGVAEFHLYYDI